MKHISTINPAIIKIQNLFDRYSMHSSYQLNSGLMVYHYDLFPATYFEHFG